MKPGLDMQQWISFCRDTAAAVQLSCGTSYRLFIEMFSQRIEQVLIRLADGDRFEAYLVARRWDYQTPIERALLSQAMG